jgi:hypothetical protein
VEPFTQEQQVALDREAKRKHREWLKSPDGRAEVERQAKVKREAEKERHAEELRDMLGRAYEAKDCKWLGIFRPARIMENGSIPERWCPDACRLDTRQRSCTGKCSRYSIGTPAWMDRECYLNSPNYSWVFRGIGCLTIVILGIYLILRY